MSTAASAIPDVEFARTTELAELRQRVLDLELTVSRLREVIPARQLDTPPRSYFREGWEQMSAEDREETLGFLEGHERKSRALRVDE